MRFGNGWSKKSRKSKYIVHDFHDNEPIIKYLAEKDKTNNHKKRFYVVGHLHSGRLHPLSNSSEVMVLGHWLSGEILYGMIEGEKYNY